MKELAITAVNCITAVGHDAAMTAAAVRAGISRFREYDEYPDREGNPVTVAQINGINDDGGTIDRMSKTAMLCLENLLNGYFQGNVPQPNCHLFLGAASEKRPGPRYGDSCCGPLTGIIKSRAISSIETVPLGNAAMQHVVARAGKLIESNPAAVCVVGCIDSLLRHSTLNWLEQADRLKSASYGRQHGLIAGEAVCFMTIEDLARARQAGRTVLARITGLGLAEDPEPRALSESGRGAGLSEACRTALSGAFDRGSSTVFGDLNGENCRAMEWSVAERRCFAGKDPYRRFWTPANCYGDIGAASGAVMAAVAAQGFSRKWLQGPALVFCSDDHGACGAMVLEKG